MKTKKALAAVLGMTMLSGSFVVSAPAEVKAADKKLVFWDKSEYVAAYNEMMKAKRNAEYLAMLDKSMAEAEAGGFVTKSIEELEAYE